MVNNNNLVLPRPPTENAGRERVMETGLLGWVGLGMDTAEVAMLGAILLLLFRVHRNIAGLLRVVRRMDRKTPEPKTGALLTGAKAEQAGLQLTGD